MIIGESFLIVSKRQGTTHSPAVDARALCASHYHSGVVTSYQCREQKAANEACRQAERAIKETVEFSLPWALLLFLKSVLTIFLSWKKTTATTKSEFNDKSSLEMVRLREIFLFSSIHQFTEQEALRCQRLMTNNHLLVLNSLNKIIYSP